MGLPFFSDPTSRCGAGIGTNTDLLMSKVELVDRSEFDTKSLKPADRFNVWQNSVGEFYDVSLRNEEVSFPLKPGPN